MKNRILALLLCALICASFTACGEASSANDTTLPQDETTAPVETGPILAVPKSDNGGKDFTILHTVHAAYEYDAAEQTGDVVNDAVYDRNAAVEELLGININLIIEPGHWADKDTFNGLIKSSVMAGDGAYDLVNGVVVCVLPIASEGVFMEASELEWVDFSNPWWIQGMQDDLAVSGKLFGFIGDASLSLYKDLSVCYFNQKLLTDYKLESPYKFVREGTWTLDKFTEMVKAVGSDLNGDGTWTETDDLFGMIFHNVPMRAFHTAAEFKVVDFDEDDNPYIVDLSDRDIELYFKLYDLIKANNNIWGKDTNDHTEFTNIFADDRALFLCDFLYDTEYLRDMTSDFGIVPYPKRDAAQEEYNTQIGTSTSMFFVPKTTNDPVLTSQVCEALSYYSYKDVVPAYYEVALKEKYTRDEDVKDMLEIIRNSAQMDFTFAYSTMFNPFINCVTPCDMNPNENIASTYATNMPKWQGVIDALLESYAELE